jgi:hypothetical protein
MHINFSLKCERRLHDVLDIARYHLDAGSFFRLDNDDVKRA